MSQCFGDEISSSKVWSVYGLCRRQSTYIFEAEKSCMYKFLKP